MREITVAVTTHGRVLVDDAVAAAPVRLLVGCHGYAQSADEMMELPSERRCRFVLDASRDPGAPPLLPGPHRDHGRELDDAAEPRPAHRRQRRLRGGRGRRSGGRPRDRAARVLRVLPGCRDGVPRRSCSVHERQTPCWRSAATCRRSSSPTRPSSFRACSSRAAHVTTGTPNASCATTKRGLLQRGARVETLTFDGAHEWHGEFAARAAAILETSS